MSLKFGILGLLNHAPMTGYNLKKLFDKSVNNIWTASLSQIYRELGALEKNGLVSSYIEEQDDRPDKKIYSISSEGKKAFMKWLSECPETFVSPKRDEFMLRVFFGASLEKNEVKRQFEKFLEDRKAAAEFLEKDEILIPKFIKSPENEKLGFTMEDGRYIGFVIKRAKMSNRLLIQWAEECIKELGE